MAAEPQTASRVVVVDDNRLVREIACDALASSVRVEACEDAEAALRALEREPAALVISDLTMPRLSGIDLLERVRREHPGTDFVLLTGNASVESAVEALRMGAADYLIKPIRAAELSMVVERILARRDLLRENGRLRHALATVDSCRTLMGCLDPGEVYAVAADLILGSLRRERGVGLFRRTSISLSDGVILRGFGDAEARALRDALVFDKPVDPDAVRELTVVDRGALHNLLRDFGVDGETALAAPVRGRDTEAGVLWTLDGGKPFDDAELERAKLIAGHAELALRNAERYHQAKERAFIDDVTELYNARFLLQATEHEIQRAERYGKELCVLFLDLDRFKLVNDRHGHLVGSQCLRQLARVLLECIRQVDTLARYGGDEFTTLLVDTGVDGGLAIAERIRRTVADTIFEGGQDTPIRLTISIGVAAYPQHSQGRDALLDLADKAMYRAKSLGRNCVCSAADLIE